MLQRDATRALHACTAAAVRWCAGTVARCNPDPVTLLSSSPPCSCHHPHWTVNAIGPRIAPFACQLAAPESTSDESTTLKLSALPATLSYGWGKRKVSGDGRTFNVLNGSRFSQIFKKRSLPKLPLPLRPEIGPIS